MFPEVGKNLCQSVDRDAKVAKDTKDAKGNAKTQRKQRRRERKEKNHRLHRLAQIFCNYLRKSECNMLGACFSQKVAVRRLRRQ